MGLDRRRHPRPGFGRPGLSLHRRHRGSLTAIGSGAETLEAAADLVCLPLAIDRETLRRYALNLGLASPAAALEALARAIAASPTWAAIPGATLLLATDTRRLAVAGRLDAAAVANVRAQTRDLVSCCAHLRYADDAEVRAACERLASRLVATLGRPALERARFVAIPRGGLVVLGLLASALGLDRGQLETPGADDAPLVVVDDCAISGARFAAFLAERRERRVVFVHLFSHPALRAAIETRERRVVACLAARDLAEHGLEGQPPGWRRRWAELASWKAYWFGRPQPLGLPWNEPDRLVWNPVTERAERGWRLVPPELCLKNRALLGAEPIPILVQPEANGPLRPGPDVVFGELEGRTFIANLESGESFALAGTAARMWRALIETGTADAAAAALAPRYDVPAATLRRDLDAFLDRLAARGLLVTA